MSKFYIRLKTMEIRKVIATSEEDALNKACESFGKENVIGLALGSRAAFERDGKSCAGSSYGECAAGSRLKKH